MPPYPVIACALVALIPLTCSALLQATTSGGLTVDGLLKIAPTSSTCSGASFIDECATAEQALPHIVNAFARYGITHPSVQAAVVSLMAYESGDFKYNKNHFPAPGTPGEGTRNMQSPAMNQKYAQSLGLRVDGAPQDIADRVEGNPDFDFGSAAWFITSQCPTSIREAMWGGSEQGWEAYLTQCVRTIATDDRKQKWKAALQALGTA